MPASGSRDGRQASDGSLAASSPLAKQIIIIGSGLAGLQTLRALLKRGFSNTLIYEDGADISCGSQFLGLSLQVPWSEVQLPEYPLPPHLVPAGPYASQEEMKEYAQSYAQAFDLTRHVRCSHRLVNLAPAKGQRWLVSYSTPGPSKDKQPEQHQMIAHFVVICTGIAAAPNMPAYSGLSDFRGVVLHSSEFKDVTLSRGRQVVLVGNGRAPPDLVAECAVAQNAASVSLLNRRVHWPSLRRLAPGISMNWLISSRVGRSLGKPRPYYTRSTGQKVLGTLMKPLKAAAWWAIKARLRAQVQSHQYDFPMEAPETDVHWGGHLDEKLWERNHEQGKVVCLEGRIRYLKPSAIVMDTGVELPCDIVIMCTGFACSLKFLDPRIVLKLQLEEDGLFLYRHIIHPEVKNLAFVGCAVTSSHPVLTFALQAQWLAAALSQEIQLPAKEAMAADIRAQRRWRRTTIKPQGNRAGLLMPYTQDYHDQLLGEMSLTPRRKGWNVIGECFSPFSAADYAGMLGGPTDANAFKPKHVVHANAGLSRDQMLSAAQMCTDYSIRPGQGRLRYYKESISNLQASHLGGNFTIPSYNGSVVDDNSHHSSRSHATGLYSGIPPRSPRNNASVPPSADTSLHGYVYQPPLDTPIQEHDPESQRTTPHLLAHWPPQPCPDTTAADSGAQLTGEAAASAMQSPPQHEPDHHRSSSQPQVPCSPAQTSSALPLCTPFLLEPSSPHASLAPMLAHDGQSRPSYAGADSSDSSVCPSQAAAAAAYRRARTTPSNALMPEETNEPQPTHVGQVTAAVTGSWDCTGIPSRAVIPDYISGPIARLSRQSQSTAVAFARGSVDSQAFQGSQEGGQAVWPGAGGSHGTGSAFTVRGLNPGHPAAVLQRRVAGGPRGDAPKINDLLNVPPPVLSNKSVKSMRQARTSTGSPSYAGMPVAGAGSSQLDNLLSSSKALTRPTMSVASGDASQLDNANQLDKMLQEVLWGKSPNSRDDPQELIGTTRGSYDTTPPPPATCSSIRSAEYSETDSALPVLGSRSSGGMRTNTRRARSASVGGATDSLPYPIDDLPSTGQQDGNVPQYRTSLLDYALGVSPSVPTSQRLSVMGLGAGSGQQDMAMEMDGAPQQPDPAVRITPGDRGTIDGCEGEPSRPNNLFMSLGAPGQNVSTACQAEKVFQRILAQGLSSLGNSTGLSSSPSLAPHTRGSSGAAGNNWPANSNWASNNAAAVVLPPGPVLAVSVPSLSGDILSSLSAGDLSRVMRPNTSSSLKRLLLSVRSLAARSKVTSEAHSPYTYTPPAL